MRRSTRVVFVLAACGLAAHVAHAAVGFGGGGTSSFVNDWVYDGIEVLAAALVVWRALTLRTERAAWLCFGAGLACWAAGDIYYSVAFAGMDSPPFPSPADYLYLAFYPLAYVGLVLLARSRISGFRRSLWFDGAIGALAIAAIGSALVFDPVLASTEGSAAAIAVNLAYPLADLLILAIVVGLVAATGWRPGRTLGFIAASFVIGGIADAIFLVQAAEGSYVEGTLLDSLWPAATLLLAYAAWREPRPLRPVAEGGLRLIALPTVFALAAIALLVYGNAGPISALSTALAALTLVLVVARLVMAFRENVGMLVTSREEALTDPLTGLANRRALLIDLERACDPHRLSPRPKLLAIYDLNGFKHYNDTFGHPAGDALLTRIGGALARAAVRSGHAYRLGGDEFCVLLDRGRGEPHAQAAAMATALLERGDGFVIGAAFGEVVIPDEALDPSEALRIADQRLYAQKAHGRASAASQARDVLLSVLRERTPRLADHVGTVAELADRLARRLDLDADEAEDIVSAAQLHDIGKAAIPDDVLNKPGELEPEERDFILRHPLVGERILSAAPSLQRAARIVRSTHERFDGGGYPDGLAGEEIPVASRLIAVCDAYDALVSSRPYRPPMTPDQAVDELRAYAGSQFDPALVELLSDEIKAHPPVPAERLSAVAPPAGVPGPDD